MPVTVEHAGTTGRLASGARAKPLREVLRAATLAGHEVLAGAGGLARPVERLNIMEVPDILPWVKPRELLLTTAYPLREEPARLDGLVADLDDAGVAGIAVKLGRYLDLLPEPMLRTADERDFPVVRLPDDVSFDEVFDDVLSGLLNRQARSLARAGQVHTELVDVVLGGGGIEEVVVALARLLDTPVVVHGPGSEVLARSHHEWPPTQGEVAPASSVQIAAGPRTLGHLAVADELGRGDELALESAATTVALVLTTRAEVRAVTSKQQSELMFDLLAGRITDEDGVTYAATFGWQLDRPLIALVLRVDRHLEPVPPGVPRSPLAEAAGRLVLDRDPTAAVVRIGDEVIALTAPFEGRAASLEFARTVADGASAAVGASVSAGLSRPVTTLGQVPAAHEQATTALRVGRRVDGDGAVAHVDDLGAHRLLSLVDDHDELMRFARESLGQLAQDTDDAADLRETLRVLLETGCNIAETARQLHFHYNTVRYRIRKLEDLLGPLTSDPRVRLDVQLALLILDMDGSAG